MVAGLTQGPFCRAACDRGQMGWEEGVVAMQERRGSKDRRVEETKKGRGGEGSRGHGAGEERR